MPSKFGRTNLEQIVTIKLNFQIEASKLLAEKMGLKSTVLLICKKYAFEDYNKLGFESAKPDSERPVFSSESDTEKM